MGLRVKIGALASFIGLALRLAFAFSAEGMAKLVGALALTRGPTFVFLFTEDIKRIEMPKVMGASFAEMLKKHPEVFHTFGLTFFHSSEVADSLPEALPVLHLSGDLDLSGLGIVDCGPFSNVAIGACPFPSLAKICSTGFLCVSCMLSCEAF